MTYFPLKGTQNRVVIKCAALNYYFFAELVCGGGAYNLIKRIFNNAY